MIERALQAHPDGRPWGFRALVPGSHTKAYQRYKASVGVGLAGAFGQLLEKYPKLGDEAGLVNLGMAAAFEDLLDENRSLGVVPDPNQAAGVIGSSCRFVQGGIQPSLHGRLDQLRGECRFGVGIPCGLCVGQAADRNERDSATSKPHRATFP
jgi:hypothetical protein